MGDSIRQMGYGTLVPSFLRDDYEVFQPDDNCRFSKYTLRCIIAEWAKDIEGSDIIHWNNGLWDMSDDGEGVFTSLEEYITTMTRIAKILQKRAKTVIFATTTPVRDENKTQDNQRIKLYNQVITPILLDMGLLINNLHETVNENIAEYIREDDLIHLTDKGIEICANQVATLIKSI